ncbi:metal-sulfur cluster assembly factor [Paracoccus benzoatiresistens]|uniref:Metal-sulfur cluster assembly factor n=1 Tax=Paracoccus benzoatiresistens TaxID=2997341 RepID=A0ABT4J9K8_9RHOB|nr:metal-sulfur cluster assembly factor [Paracoccus sp. EF6]MCZ0963131.1 metal-sulfur cluster assembly factor [Paracoccus sp. EF6]
MADDPRTAVLAALRQVMDPEAGQDLVSMGLVYDVAVRDGRASVIMTTTTRGCPLSEMLRMGAEAAVLAVPGVTEADVALTWDPPWTPDRIEARAF